MRTIDSLPRNVQERLVELCREYGVKQLELFGSAARDLPLPEANDLDFLVEFQQLAPGRYAESYFGLLSGLEELFGRPVDLLVTSAIQNRYFLEAIQRDRTTLYAA